MLTKKNYNYKIFFSCCYFLKVFVDRVTFKKDINEFTKILYFEPNMFNLNIQFFLSVFFKNGYCFKFKSFFVFFFKFFLSKLTFYKDNSLLNVSNRLLLSFAKLQFTLKIVSSSKKKTNKLFLDKHLVTYIPVKNRIKYLIKLIFNLYFVSNKTNIKQYFIFLLSDLFKNYNESFIYQHRARFYKYLDFLKKKN